MKDYEADEIVKQPKRSDRMPFIDKALGATGIVLAGLATFFPWYAFLHQDRFAMPTLWQGSKRDLPPGTPNQTEFETSPAAMTAANPETREAIDRLTTATVPGPSGGGRTADGQDGLEQPFPSASGFRLLHVANGRALIEDASGMYLVRIGSLLPDNSTLATLEQVDGRWVMITSNGATYRSE